MKVLLCVTLIVAVANVANCGTWTELNPTGLPIIPHPRSENALAPSPDGWYVFAGWGGDHILDCFWHYTTKNSTWYRYTAFAQFEGGPSPRYGMRAQFENSSNTLFIFGGWDTSQYYSTLWTFDFSTMAWTLQKIGSVPPARAYSSFTALGGGQYLVYGGVGDAGVLNDVWFYNSGSNSFTRTLGGAGPRSYHTADYYNGNVYVFGGANSTGVNSELWQYNIQSNKWNYLGEGGPKPRQGHTSTSGDGFLWIFGGDDGKSTVFNDFWQYSFVTNEWTEITDPNPPSARTNLGLGAYSGGIYVFGGESGIGYNDDVLNDLYVYVP